MMGADLITAAVIHTVAVQSRSTNDDDWLPGYLLDSLRSLDRHR